jgi:hypothetical protein
MEKLIEEINLLKNRIHAIEQRAFISPPIDCPAHVNFTKSARKN